MTRVATVEGARRQRKAAKALAQRLNTGEHLRCHCPDCDARRTAPARTRDETWARMERENEARRLARVSTMERDWK